MMVPTFWLTAPLAGNLAVTERSSARAQAFKFKLIASFVILPKAARGFVYLMNEEQTPNDNTNFVFDNFT